MAEGLGSFPCHAPHAWPAAATSHLLCSTEQSTSLLHGIQDASNSLRQLPESLCLPQQYRSRRVHGKACHARLAHRAWCSTHALCTAFCGAAIAR